MAMVDVGLPRLGNGWTPARLSARRTVDGAIPRFLAAASTEEPAATSLSAASVAEHVRPVILRDRGCRARWPSHGMRGRSCRDPVILSAAGALTRAALGMLAARVAPVKGRVLFEVDDSGDRKHSTIDLPGKHGETVNPLALYAREPSGEIRISDIFNRRNFFVAAKVLYCRSCHFPSSRFVSLRFHYSARCAMCQGGF